MLGFGGQGIYLAELRRVHGWPSTLISTVSIFSLLLISVPAIFTDDIMVRIGPRRPARTSAMRARTVQAIPGSAASAAATDSALSVTVRSSELACTVTFSAKKRASET